MTNETVEDRSLVHEMTFLKQAAGRIRDGFSRLMPRSALEVREVVTDLPLFISDTPDGGGDIDQHIRTYAVVENNGYRPVFLGLGRREVLEPLAALRNQDERLWRVTLAAHLGRDYLKVAKSAMDHFTSQARGERYEIITESPIYGLRMPKNA